MAFTHGLVCGEVWVRRVLIEGPFHYVAHHVVQTPSIRLFACDLLILAFAVCCEPRIVA